MREVIRTGGAPAAIGPYSQAIRAGDLLFVSGQIAMDPATGTVIEGGVAEQTHQVLKNAAQILAAGGSSLGDVVKTTVYLTEMANFAAMNEVYGQYFTGEPPARATVAVVGLPKDVLVEIDLIARVAS
jgi:2-iminobutanoate/2-iminopropanoate deaminase